MANMRRIFRGFSTLTLPHTSDIEHKIGIRMLMINVKVQIIMSRILELYPSITLTKMLDKLCNL